MFSKKIFLNGGIILIVCLACALPVVAFELNPMNYILKQPVPVQTVNKTLVNHAIGSVERVTILPRVTTTASPGGVPTMSQVHSGTGTCTQDTPVTTLEGTITEIQYTDVYDTTFTFIKLSGGGEAAIFAADGGNRDRVNHLLETAYIKGNTIRIITGSGCMIESFTRFDGTTKDYPSYKILIIDLGPVHP